MKPDRLVRQNRLTEPLDPTTLMDGQRVGALQTRLSRVGQKNPPKLDPPDPSPPLPNTIPFLKHSLRFYIDGSRLGYQI